MKSKVLALTKMDNEKQYKLDYHEINIPDPGPNQVIVKVMAAGINYNAVWSLIAEPIDCLARINSSSGTRHNYHIIGSEASGIVSKVGKEVTKFLKGDHVIISPLVVDRKDFSIYDPNKIGERSKIWGYDTNFGALSQYVLVDELQLLTKPKHFSWAEASVYILVSSTVYRMLVSERGASIRMGEKVLIWGAAGGLGSMACQYVLRAGGIPIGVIRTNDKNKISFLKSQGVSRIICTDNRKFIDEDGNSIPKSLVWLKKKVEFLVGHDGIDIVFEHTGRQTFSASVFIANNTGRIVTCGSTSGPWHSYDNRYLWIAQKRIIGVHFASLYEIHKSNQLAINGIIHPVRPVTFRFEEKQAIIAHLEKMLNSVSFGKMSVLIGAESENEGQI